MPEFTVYAKILRHGTGRKRHRIKNTPILRFHQYPISWQDLKDTLTEAAQQAHYTHNQQTLEVTVDKHLRGRYIKQTITYRDVKTMIDRNSEFSAKITYNQFTNTIKIQTASFNSFDFFSRYKEDYDLERKKKFKLQKPVPPSYLAELMNPECIYKNQPQIQTPNYDAVTRGLYGTMQEKQWMNRPYEAIPQDSYGRINDKVKNQDKLLKQH